MKTAKIIISLTIAVCASGLSVQAQESTEITRKGPEIIGHLGISGAPLAAASYFSGRSSSGSNYGTMSSIYEDYSGSVSTTGTLLAGVDIKLNRVVAISVNLGVNALWRDSYSGVTKTKTGASTGMAVYLFPMAKLYYMNRDLFRLYGSVGFGVGKYFGYPQTSSSTLFKNPLKLEGQIVPVGVELGRKFFGFAEFGIGTIYMGIQAGAGYRF